MTTIWGIAFVWIAIGLVILAGALLALRTLHRVLMAARQLQATVDNLKSRVDGQMQELNGEIKDLGETIDDTRRK